MARIAETFFFRATLVLTVFLNVCGALNFFIPNLKSSLALLISLLVSPILAPSLQYVHSYGEKKIHVKWMFCKKPLIFNC